MRNPLTTCAQLSEANLRLTFGLIDLGTSSLPRLSQINMAGAEEFLSEGALAIERSHNAELSGPWQPGTCGRWEDLLQELTEWQFATVERSRTIFSRWREDLVGTFKEPDTGGDSVSFVILSSGEASPDA